MADVKPILTMSAGTTPTHTITVSADITGWTAKLTVKAAAGWESTPDASALVNVSSPSGLTVTPGTSSTVAWHVAAAQSAALPAGVYVWDLTLTSGSEAERVEWPDGSFVGTLTVVPAVRIAP